MMFEEQLYGLEHVRKSHWCFLTCSNEIKYELVEQEEAGSEGVLTWEQARLLIAYL
jgi:hypothetical protein